MRAHNCGGSSLALLDFCLRPLLFITTLSLLASFWLAQALAADSPILVSITLLSFNVGDELVVRAGSVESRVDAADEEEEANTGGY